MSGSGREPVPLSAGEIPSSFDDNPEFFEEGRASKLWRKLRQEPLIPLGGLATCYALYMATKSIRAGDHHQTNRMFRARIYAQGFTLVAIVAGSIFYQDERLKRRTFEKALEEKKALEKRDKWLRELEARDAEDRAWREMVTQTERESNEVVREAKESLQRVKGAVEEKFSSKSMRERIVDDGWGPGTWVWRTKEAWRRM
ncbi:Respiratory supercomplex factor 1, mitochondrial [Neophaeococcomyces mojaviensis]|uniref:Respiratory supercomplex factor 1, mitochondrial n=1 Tax=Neophaeococcomyces mojaviensis TaxID=3383035 RepID=A0ACC3A5I7_9EURO|nr:Respiratory supercomplex factor 1, mitochondrial [Knufia sp. JES_112]